MPHRTYTLTRLASGVLLGVTLLAVARYIPLPVPLLPPPVTVTVTPAVPLARPSARATLDRAPGLTNPRTNAMYIAFLQRGVHPNQVTRLDRLTAYNPVPSQTDRDPSTASCGPLRPDTLALSQDLFLDHAGRKGLCGKKALVVATDQHGHVVSVEVKTIWDAMNRRYLRSADILIPTPNPKQALAWGVKRGGLAIIN